MAKIKLKVIETKIKEIDFSEVVNTDNMTKEEQIENIKEMFKFNDDKEQMNRMINGVSGKTCE